MFYVLNMIDRTFQSCVAPEDVRRGIKRLSGLHVPDMAIRIIDARNDSVRLDVTGFLAMFPAGRPDTEQERK